MSSAIGTQGFKLEVATNDSPVGSYVEVKEVVNFQMFDGKAAEIDVTHLRSTAKEFRMGLQDFGNCTFDLNYVSSDPGQVAVRAAKASQTLKTFKATFSNGVIVTFQAYAMSASLAGGVDSKVDTSFNFRVSGDAVYS